MTRKEKIKLLADYMNGNIDCILRSEQTTKDFLQTLNERQGLFYQLLKKTSITPAGNIAKYCNP